MNVINSLVFALVDAVLERYKTAIWRGAQSSDTAEDWRLFALESASGDARLGWWRSTWGAHVP